MKLGVFVLFLSCLTGCNSCYKPSMPLGYGTEDAFVDSYTPITEASTEQPKEAEPPKEQEFKHKHFSVILPPNWFIASSSPDPSIPLLAVNGEYKFAISVNEYSDYSGAVLSAIRGIKESGAAVLETSKVTINGHEYTRIYSTKGSRSFYTWITTSGPYTYGVSCSGDVADVTKVKCEHILT